MRARWSGPLVGLTAPWYRRRVQLNDRAYLKRFFQAVADAPLEAGDPRYVALYEDNKLADDDPVELLARAIEFSPGESVQLLSGFRGTGKSTELRRLEKRLVEAGYQVVLVDIADYVNLSTPIDITDFLMAIAGAFGDSLERPEHLGKDPKHQGYWTRFAAFLQRTHIEIPEVSVAEGVALKANLKSDPTFKERLQQRMAGHLGALVADVHRFFEDCVRLLKDRHGEDVEVVLLVDSAERIRGTSANASDVHSSVETLFVGHADKLKLPYLHVIYTVPPYLKVRSANLGALYDAGAVQIFPAVKLRYRTTGEAYVAGLDALKRVVTARAEGDWARLLGTEARLKRLVLASGGHLRDLLRLISEVIRRARELPVDDTVIEAAINQIKTEFLPITNVDALWLARVAESHQAEIEDLSRLPDLARFFDTHVVLCYRDGPEWYDVHPLIRDVVVAQAREIEARRGGAQP